MFFCFYFFLVFSLVKIHICSVFFFFVTNFFHFIYLEFRNYISIVNHIILPRLYSTVFSAPSESTDHDGTDGQTDDERIMGRMTDGFRGSFISSRRLNFFLSLQAASSSSPSHFFFKASQVARYILHIYLAPLPLNPDGQ